jgi:Flp pilus assembly pilin Flp
MRLEWSSVKVKQATKRCLDNLLLKMYVRLCQKPSGQTLAEYALIFAALSIAAFAAYQSIGNGVVVLGNGLSSELTSV